MIKSFRNKASDRFYLHLYIQPFAKQQSERKNFNKENTIALITHPRGGSTWLAELLKTIPDAALVDEPLFRGLLQTNGKMPDETEGKLRETRTLNFYYYQPIPENADWPEAENLFYKLFNREIANLHIYRETNIRKLSTAQTFIYKFNYAHLLLPWLVDKFPVKAITLTRHPCAVIASQMKHPAWKMVMEKPAFHIPDFRYNNLFLAHEEILSQLKTPEEILAAIWAMCTKNTLSHAESGKKWLNISYEKLLLSPEEELQRIFLYLNRPVPQDIEHILNKPSVSTAATSFPYLSKENKAGQLCQWKNVLSRNQIKNIFRVLDAFEIDIYTDTPEPDYYKIYK